MKFLLLVAIVFAAVWLWSSNRRQVRGDGARPSGEAPTRQRPAPGAQEMVACAVCQLHVPRSEAVAGRRGTYCGAEHRQRAEG